jgi:transposase
LQQGLSWGWIASIWLAHIMSQGDHRKLTVRDWVRQAHSTLELVTGLDIRETDFTDDRLTIVLRHLSDVERWQAIEQALGRHLVRVYDLGEQPIRVDGTTVSGYRDGGEGSLWQFGHSKDDPTLRQIKVMMATLDPLGLLLALEGVSGEQADDWLYVPTIERVLACLERQGLLTYRFERQVEQEVKWVGRGRGVANRKFEVSERVRYQITAVSRNTEALAAQVERLCSEDESASGQFTLARA